MKYLKLKCNDQLVGPKEITVKIPNTEKEVTIWIVSGIGIEVMYDSNGNEIENGVSEHKVGICVDAKYRTIQCGTGTGEIVWGVEEIEVL